MDKNVYDLASEDTRLSKKSRDEYAGPCPNCGGSDRFIVNMSKNGGSGGFMCRGCWDTKNPPIRPDRQRWGDAIDYYRHFKGMNFTQAQAAARAFLSEQVDDAIEQLERFSQRATEPRKPAANEPPAQDWQDRNIPQVQAAATRLWTPDAAPVLDYLRARGLSDDTIRAARLGAIHTSLLKRLYWIPRQRLEVDTWYVVIPWSIDGSLWQVELRDIRPDCPAKERYCSISGSSNGLYLADCLKVKRPTFLVEGAIDALTLAQEAGKLVNVVATGSTDGAQIAKWTMRLARMPIVFVAFDNEPKGDEKSTWWLERLAHKSPIRFRPLRKDVNAMHLFKPGLTQKWVQAALSVWEEQQEDASEPIAESVAERVVTPVSPELPDQAASEPLLCSVCGLDAIEDDGFYFSLDGVPFCSTHGPDAQQATQSPEQSKDQAKDTRAAFMRVVNEVAAAALGPDVQITLEPRQTLKAFLSEQGIRSQDASREYEPVTLPALPRKRCPHEIVTVKADSTLKRSFCSGVPGPQGWCKEHESVHLLLSLACKLNYPRLQVSEALIIESGAGCWEEFAIRSLASVPYLKNHRTMHSEKRLTKLLPRLKSMVDERERAAQAHEQQQKDESEVTYA